MSRLGTALQVLTQGEKAIGAQRVMDAGGVLGFHSGHIGLMPKRGTVELLKAYSELPWMRAIGHRISHVVATAEWQAFRPTTPDPTQAERMALGLKRMSTVTRRRKLVSLTKGEEIEEIPHSPVLGFMDLGNPLLGGTPTRQATQMHLDLVGEGFGLIERDGMGLPTQWWILPPHWVKETPVPGGEPVFVVKADGSTVQQKIPADQVIWFKDVDPFNPYGRGSGMGKALADELDSDEAAAKHIKAWFNNGAKPDMIVTAEGATDAQSKRLEQSWLEKLQGTWNRHKPHFLNRTIQVHELTSSFKDMELVDLRKFERDTIIQVFGIPPEVFGIIESSNRATIESADFLFSKHVIVPRLELMREVLQEQLVPMFGENVVLDFVSPVEEDKAHKLDAMKAAPWAFRVDEIRAAGLEGELDDDAGRVFMTPMTLTAFEEPGGGATHPDQEPEEAPLMLLPDEDEDDGNEDENDGDEERGFSTQKDERTEESVIQQVLRAMEEFSLTPVVTPIILDAIAIAGEQQMAELGVGIAFNLDDPGTISYLRNSAGTRIRAVNNATLKAVRQSLITGFDRGLGVNGMTPIVKNVVGLSPRQSKEMMNLFFRLQADGIFGAELDRQLAAAKRSKILLRAHTIARTETVGASSTGFQEAMRQADIQEKEWLSARDGRVRTLLAGDQSDHSSVGLDGQRVPIADDFISAVTGATGQGPGLMSLAEDSVNCRCTLIPARGERSLADTEEKRTKFWKARETIREPQERRLERTLLEAFGKQEDAAIHALRRG